jgi:hypothetical protein
MTHIKEKEEKFGKIIIQMADLLRRVMKGSLNVEYVSRRLQEIIDYKLTPDAYHIFVDYGRSVEDGVKAGRYGRVDFDITSRNFPTKRKGTAKIEVELIHFNRRISTDEALRKLDRMGYRPAELRELLAFGEKYPEVQREFPVVALGSVWLARSGSRRAPCLDWDDSDHSSCLELSIVEFDWTWTESCRFAAVRK